MPQGDHRVSGLGLAASGTRLSAPSTPSKSSGDGSPCSASGSGWQQQQPQTPGTPVGTSGHRRGAGGTSGGRIMRKSPSTPALASGERRPFSATVAAAAPFSSTMVASHTWQSAASLVRSAKLGARKEHMMSEGGGGSPHAKHSMQPALQVQKLQSAGGDHGKLGTATPTADSRPSTSLTRQANGHSSQVVKGRPGANRPRLTVDTSMTSERSSSRRRGIKVVERFSDHYELGSVVMPSCHRDMEIRYAKKVGKSGKEVVVKVRRKPGSFGTQHEEQAWRQNTELVMSLPMCPTIAHIEEVLEDDAGYYVIMEKVAGLDLHETLHRSGPMPLEDIKEVLRQLLHAVDQLHSSGCIHKDLKLENVMLERHPKDSAPQTPNRTSPNRVKLVDFDTVEDWSPKSPKATRVLGTDQYISPEAYDGRYSPASDIFAIGVIAYRLIAGTFPFRDTMFDDKPGENWVGSPKMREIRDKLASVRLDWQKPGFLALGAQDRSGAQRLIARMLAVNEMHRPGAREALSDPWLATDKIGAVSVQQLRRHASMPVDAKDKHRISLSSTATSSGSSSSAASPSPSSSGSPAFARRALAVPATRRSAPGGVVGRG